MNNNTHHHAALHHCSLAIAAVAMAITMNSCQDEEFGFTKEEIAATAAARHYKEAFQEEFAKIDPNHTWMCTPDTIVGGQLMAVTRAAGDVPTVTYVADSVLEMSADACKHALEYLKEEADNRGKGGQDFEYIATEEKHVYDIHPVFWGRKFVDTNFVGVWYIDDSGKKVDLPPFWTDGYHATDSWPGDNYITITSHVQATRYQNPADYQWYDIPTTESQITDLKIDGHTPYKYRFPSFKVEVPVGMKWGLYLQTKTRQSGGKDVRWYSNAEYNVNHCSAAASYSIDGINYVSFEDAPNPYNCSSQNSGHQCTKHPGDNDNANGYYGHYDHDMNDIVLAITPHPIESTYKAIKYRVMCEDLGGTFDWDFNDLVLDVLYEEGKKVNNKWSNATTKIEVLAVGGTLPIELICSFSNAQKQNGLTELHSWFGQDPTSEVDEELLYEPINVIGSHTEFPAKVAYIITHDWATKPEGFDVREVVKTLSVVVNGHTTVVFPDSKGGEIPQCFMCPINVDWSSELVNISKTYSDFPAWVASQGETDWWMSGFNTGTQEIKQ